MPEHPTSGCQRTNAIHHFQVNQTSITVVNLQRFLLLFLKKVFYWYPGPNSALSHSPKTPIIIRDNKGEKGQPPPKKKKSQRSSTEESNCDFVRALWQQMLSLPDQLTWCLPTHVQQTVSVTHCATRAIWVCFSTALSFKKKKKKNLKNLICSPVRWGIPHWLHPTPTLHSTLWKLWEGKHRKSYRK